MTTARAGGTSGAEAADEADAASFLDDGSADEAPEGGSAEDSDGGGGVDEAADGSIDEGAWAEEANSDDAGCEEGASADDGAEDGSVDDGADDGADGAIDACDDDASDDGSSDDGGCDDGGCEEIDGSTELTSLGGGTSSTLIDSGSAGAFGCAHGNSTRPSTSRCSTADTATVTTMRRSRGGGSARGSRIGATSLMAGLCHDDRGDCEVSPLSLASAMLAPMRLDTLLLSLSTFFATLGPADLILVYAAITERHSRAERQMMALRGVLIATGILLFFAIFGQTLLALFGITLPALRIAGGILLLLISIDMVFARHSGGTGTTPEEEKEARTRPDISVFPLATPLIAGPGAISATILLASSAGLFTLAWFEVVVGMLAILTLCWLGMLVAIPIQRLLGLTGLAVVSRVVGVLLAALAMQFLIDGIRSAGMFGAA